MKVMATIMVTRSVNIPDEYFLCGDDGYELTPEGYDKYMGEDSAILEGLNEDCVIAIETMDGFTIAEY